VNIGRQPMIMVRQGNGKVDVLYNLVRTGVRSWSANLKGNTATRLSARTTRGVFLDGSVRAIPLAKGYEARA